MRIIITAGPTREPIDPVRYISNYSSGKMGYALANAAVLKGAEVILISGPTSLPIPKKVKFIQVNTAQEMYDAVMAEIKNCAIFIGVAAVADYKPAKFFAHKIKRTKKSLTIKLVRNPDILAQVAALPQPPFTVGFAAETEDVLKNAQQKLTSKKVNMIIANRVGPDRGFDSDKNKVTILAKNHPPINLPLMKKTDIAKQIINILLRKKYRID
jgi:phosphopantothenoylcysteine decarboxylase/phosphopantothenate--cysteine ligase